MTKAHPNKTKAQRVAPLVATYKAQYLPDEDLADVLTDIIADVLHLAHRYGMAERVTDRSQRHFRHERAEHGEEEVSVCPHCDNEWPWPDHTGPLEWCWDCDRSMR